MKRAVPFVLLILATLASAASLPEEYSINVHVTSSYRVPAARLYGEHLDVIIDGKKYQLATEDNGYLLGLGDYKSKLVKDVHKSTYESQQEYEFLLRDKKTRTFLVVGQSE